MKSIIPSKEQLVAEYEKLDRLRMELLHEMTVLILPVNKKYSQCTHEIARLVIILDALYPKWYKE